MSSQQKPVYLLTNLRKNNAKTIKTGESSVLIDDVNTLRNQLAAAHNEINQLKALTQQVTDVKTKTDYLYDDKMTLRDAQKYVIKEFFKQKIRTNPQSELEVGIFNDRLYKFSKEFGIPVAPIEAQSLMCELNYPYSQCDQRQICYYPGIELVE